MKKTLVIFILFLIIFLGLLFRLKGIQSNHSFWSDEAYGAGLARDIITGEKTPLIALSRLNYEPLFILTESVFLRIFGHNEFSARIPVVLLGTAGILGAFLLAFKLSGISAGLLAAFISAFSQINLANSTQAKPYSILQTLLLFEIYALILLHENKKNNSKIHLLIIFLCLTSTFFHLLGTLFWLPYFFYLTYGKQYKFNKHRINLFYIFLICCSAILLFALYYYRINFSNHLTYFRELFWSQYSLFSLSALFGFIYSLKYRKIVHLGIFALIAVYLFLWTFAHYTHNVRYILPLFSLLFVYFSVFWSEVGRRFFKQKSSVVCIIIAMLLYLGGIKIVRKPVNYYNPNSDLYGDVQIADYKTAFGLISEKFPRLDNVAVFNDWYDTQYWYLKNKLVTAYFIKGYEKPKPFPVDQTMSYGTLNQFLKVKNKYSKGLLIVEDWESFLPEDIKQYAKKNMKREFRVDGLPQAQGDNWPLE